MKGCDKTSRNHILSLQLAQAVKLCVESRYAADELDWAASNSVCMVLEAIFIRRMRDRYLITSAKDKFLVPNFWPFIFGFVHPNVRAQICNLSQIKNDIGKARAWIRLALNEGTIESYVNSIMLEPLLVSRFYHTNAYLADAEEMSILRSLASSMTKLPFRAAVNSSLLNSWTHSPLKIAGYLSPKKMTPSCRDGRWGISEEDEFTIEADGKEKINFDELEAESALEVEGLGDSMMSSTLESDTRSDSTSDISRPLPSIRPRLCHVIGGPTVRSSRNSHNTYNDRSVFSDMESVRSDSSSNFYSKLMASGAGRSSPMTSYCTEEMPSSARVTHARSLPYGNDSSPSEQCFGMSPKDATCGSLQYDSTTGLSTYLTGRLDTAESTSGAYCDKKAGPSHRISSRDHVSANVEISSYCNANRVAVNVSNNSKSNERSGKISKNLSISQDGSTLKRNRLLDWDQRETRSASISSDLASNGRNLFRSGSDNKIADKFSERTKRKSIGIANRSMSISRSLDLGTEVTLTGNATISYVNKIKSLSEDAETATCSTSKAEPDVVAPSESLSDSYDHSGAYPSGNSLIGRRGWSMGAVPCDDAERSVEITPADETEESSFTSTVFRVFNETLSKFGFSSTDQLLPSSTVKASGEDVRKTSAATFAVAADQSSGFGDEKISGAYLSTSQDGDVEGAAESEYVVVEKTVSNVEPIEKYFRASCLEKFSHEIGLGEQDFKCFGCRRTLGLMFGSYRLCEFDGRYYCLECHLNEESVLPYRILANWDFKPRKVSRASKAFLDYVADQPLLKLVEINPTLADVVDKVREVREMRQRLSFAAMYLLTCRDVIAEDFKKRAFPKDYLYEEVDLYSITDLKDTVSGLLQKQLRSLLQFATKHILETCRLCASKGFICEICNVPDLVYPFQFEIVNRCGKCYSVCHKKCTDDRPCPRCVRKEMYAKATFDSGIDMNPLADF